MVNFEKKEPHVPDRSQIQVLNWKKKKLNSGINLTIEAKLRYQNEIKNQY